ncbi:BTB/POZ domain-containing protein 9-like protein, partial [Leptotrombidium deliense]
MFPKIASTKNCVKSSAFSDVTFVDEGESLKLHKCILGGICPYFEALLFGSLNEAKQDIIRREQTPLVLFKAVVDFIYTGRVVVDQMTQDLLVTLLCLAHEYQLQEMVDYLSP